MPNGATTGYEPNAQSPTEMTADELLDLYLQQHALQQQQASPHGAAPGPSGPLALAPMSPDLAPSPIAVQALTQTFAPTSSTLALSSSAPQTLVQAFAQPASPKVPSPVTSLIPSHFGPPMPRNPLLQPAQFAPPAYAHLQVPPGLAMLDAPSASEPAVQPWADTLRSVLSTTTGGETFHTPLAGTPTQPIRRPAVLEFAAALSALSAARSVPEEVDTELQEENDDEGDDGEAVDRTGEAATAG